MNVVLTIAWWTLAVLFVSFLASWFIGRFIFFGSSR